MTILDYKDDLGQNKNVLTLVDRAIDQNQLITFGAGILKEKLKSAPIVETERSELMGAIDDIVNATRENSKLVMLLAKKIRRE